MMGVRVRIENTGETESTTTAVVEFFDPEDSVSSTRLGQLIGYAMNAMDCFVVPDGERLLNAAIVAGICEVLGLDFDADQLQR
jgi:hypothetical protein